MDCGSLRCHRLKTHPRSTGAALSPVRHYVAVILLFIAISPPAFAAIPTSERDALIALYTATKGPGWVDSTNWLGAPGTECTWFGVICDPGQTLVTAIYLGENGLNGPLPSSLSDLTELSILDLPQNSLFGEIPSSIWTIPNLFHLNLMENDLTGTIDPQPTMHTLILGGNSFSGGIEPICDCPELIDLNLSSNQFSGPIPACIGNLTDLFSVVMDNNMLSGPIPSQIGNLIELLRLILHDSQLTGTIPTTIGNLSKLENLALDGNSLSGSIPKEIGNLSSLKGLGLSSNQLSGSIPPEIGNLTTITDLNLGMNQLTGQIPSETGNLTGLRYLAIGRNQLTGTIPPELGKLKNLETLILQHNQLSGTIPPELGDMASLQSLILLKNQLTGSIPGEIGQLSNLVKLALGGNRLTGSIPPEIGNLTQLTRLRLHDNFLSGLIPPELANLTNLETQGLRLSHNALYSDDESLRTFLNSRHEGHDFEATQTVPPTELAVTSVTYASVSLQWTPIRYTDHSGGYRVYLATSSTGPFTLATSTRDKTASGALVGNLSPSSTYYFNVDTITYPHDSQQNTVFSETTSAVMATTVSSEPDVVVLGNPRVMSAFADGVSTDSTSLTISNAGQEGTTVSLVSSGAFFTISTASVTLAPRGTSTISIASLPQSTQGDYRGSISLSGNGVPASLSVPVTLFAAPSPPTGDPLVEVESTRVDVSGPRDTNPSGSVAFRNVGTGTATGILGADQAWIIPESSTLSIAPNETQTFTFDVDRTLRPDADLLSGSQHGTLEFVYVAGSEAGAAGRSPFDSAPTLVTPVGISDTVKPTEVECPPPPFACVIEIPQLSENEVGLVVPGVGNITGSVGVFISDVTIGNPGGLPVDDLRLYYGDKAVKQPVAAGRSVALADVAATVFDKSETVGALHLRTQSALEIALNANVFVKTNPAGTFGTAIPVFRTDRGAASSEVVTITGLRKTETSHTNLYLQEVMGSDTSVQIEFLDATGSAIGLSDLAVSSFGTTIIGQAAVPEGSVTARITNTGAGSIVAYATPVDRASDDTWAVADWNQVYGFEGTEKQVVAVAGSAPGRNDTYFQTDLAIFSESSGTATLRYYQQTPAVSQFEESVSFDARETKELDDVVVSLFEAGAPSLGYIVVLPGPDTDLTTTSRTYTTVRDSSETFGTGVPTLPKSAALRLGQSVVIGGLEDSTAATTNAQRPATFRTNIGLVEVEGASARVRVSVLLFDGTQLAAGGSTASKTYDLVSHQWHQLNAIVGEIVGRELRESDFGELRNVQVKVEVVEGDGAVIVYATQTDNGTGDTVLRFE